MSSKKELDVEEALHRVASHARVKGVVMFNRADGATVKTTLDPADTAHYLTIVVNILKYSTEAVQEDGAKDEIQFMRIKTRQSDLLIAPEGAYCLFALIDDEGAQSQ
eukprot:Trichotokara_eunicae@DN5681_c0_g1_i1.p2